MSHVKDSRVLETSTTTGTGSLTVAGAVSGFKSFASAKQDNGSTSMQVGDTFWYNAWAVDSNGNPTGDYEEGLGTYSGTNTVARTTILQSSNGGSAVSFSAGTKYVAISATASKLLQFTNETAIILPKASVASVSFPIADTLAFYARKLAGRMIPSWKDPTGYSYRNQPALWTEKVLEYKPNNGTTIGLNLGGPWVAGGTVSHPAPSTTSPAIVNQIWRSRFANVATTTNQVLGVSVMASNTQRYLRGNASGVGGFFFNCRFIVELWPAATVRLFIGLSDQTTAAVASDTLAGNCIGLWHDTTDAASVLSIATRNGTTATKTSVGTLAANLQAGQCYEFTMWCQPNDSHVYVRLDEINTGTTIAENLDVTATLPTNTAFMGVQAHMSNGTANTTVTTTALGISSIYAASNY